MLNLVQSCRDAATRRRTCFLRYGARQAWVEAIASVNGLMPAFHHPPHNDTIPKLIPEEYASSSESGRAKKKVNLHLDWRSCGEVARHSRVREEGSLHSEFVDEFNL